MSRCLTMAVLCLAGSLPAAGMANQQLPAGMESLDDRQMAEVSGTGIAIALNDFYLSAHPTSYIELVGVEPETGDPWERGDLRWYGLSLSSADSGGQDWRSMVDGVPSACDDSTDLLGCPMGSGGIQSFASPGNPYLLRVFDYSGVDVQGNENQVNTVLELVGPTAMDPFRWSFWGEIEVGRALGAGENDGSEIAHLQNQVIILGTPTSVDHLGVERGSVLRLFQTLDSDDRTLGINYISRLSGDFRFSAAQTGSSPDLLRSVPEFDSREGLYFRDVQAYVPLGQLHYQSLTADRARDADGNSLTDGNFRLTVTRLPLISDSVTREELYGFVGGDVIGYETARLAWREVALGENHGVPQRYYETHGYVRWGDASTVNGFAADDSGVFFRNATGAPDFQVEGDRPAELSSLDDVEEGWGIDPANVPRESYGPVATPTANIGDARIEGLLMNHLSISTCGAGGGSGTPTGAC